jgi:tRNA pseudouridine13 synthase
MTGNDDLPYAHGGPPLRGRLRAAPEDFFVDEDLGFELEGTGEHIFVRIEKRGANTDWIARELAKFAGVRPDAISYSGMKDRHAVTRQTFSLHMPGKADPDWSVLRSDEFRVLSAARHSRKLKRGTHKRNLFKIILRDVTGDAVGAGDIVRAIGSNGVPNYFGDQRFGRDAANVDRALAMFAGRRVQRHERSMLLSAARSQMFNSVLAGRVRDGSWNRALDGDVWMLAGSHSIFGPESITDELSARCASGDIDPTGPLWGAGELRSRALTETIERHVAAEHPILARGLEGEGLKQERRSLVLRPESFEAAWLTERDFELSFSLKAGSYATVIIREICKY